MKRFSPISAKMVMLNIFALVAIGALVMTEPAQAASYRTSSYTYGSSYLNGSTVVTDSNGNEIQNFYSSQDYDSEYKNSNTPDVAAFFDRYFRQPGQTYDDTGASYTASWSGFASTGYGTNKASISMKGTLTNQTYSDQFTSPTTGNTATISTSDSKWLYADSVWEELFLITPLWRNLRGTEANMTVHMRLDGNLSGDTAYYGYNLSNWDWSSVTSDYANGDVTVDKMLTGIFKFKYGDPLYLKSQLYMGLSGLGDINMAHTVQITGIDIPTDSMITFLSGAPSDAYGNLFGGSGYGEYGNGTGGSTVPIPGTVWLLGTGLLGLVGVRRKYKIRTGVLP